MKVGGRGKPTEENCSKVTNDVDYEKDAAFLRAHGKIAAFGVPGNWMGFCCRDEKVVDGAGGAEDGRGGVRGESKGQDDDNNHDRVDLC